MAANVSESITLRTYPFGESDLVVSFLTRDKGKLRGVAKRARKPKSPFGAGLERLCCSRMTYYQRENRELVTLSGCEIVNSPFSLAGDYASVLTLDFMAEVAEALLPPASADDRFYRLILSVMSHLESQTAGAIWRSLPYFAFWAVKLSGFLPELRVSEDSISLAKEMANRPVEAVRPGPWGKGANADLRRFLIHEIEMHAEKRLLTAPLVEALPDS
ncbi:MAG: DNA repair protein RecO [Bryobacterales bacterium]|nr:DNA repair protein RecO [Bryobacterales bacterium]